MAAKKPARRKPTGARELTEILTVRLSAEQMERIREAAEPWRVAEWARVQLVKAAEDAVSRKGGR